MECVLSLSKACSCDAVSVQNVVVIMVILCDAVAVQNKVDIMVIQCDTVAV